MAEENSVRPALTETTTVRSAQPVPRCRCDLTPLDLAFLFDGYTQMGIVYPKPSEPFEAVTRRLQRSLSRCLVHFYPLAGRFATDPETHTVFIDCNDAGAEFIVGTRSDISISDLLCERGDVPTMITSLIPYEAAVNHDGHTLSLVAIQVTEVGDGIFLGFSFNHSVGDGTSFVHFLRCWSELSSQGDQDHQLRLARPPVLDRSLSGGPRPLRFASSRSTDKAPPAPTLSQRIFRFSRNALSNLKTKANEQSNKMQENAGETVTTISSFQALSALMLRAITRARKLGPDKMITFFLPLNGRHRLEEPLPEEYFGNCLIPRWTQPTVAEVLNHDLSWVARTIHELIQKKTFDGVPDASMEVRESFVMMAGSPRLDQLECDFGWGKALGSVLGSGGKFDGKVGASQGKQGVGSIDLEVFLSPEVMTELVKDEELLEALAQA